MLCIDLIGPYTIHRKGTPKNEKKKKNIILWCVPMIDPVAGWFEIAEIKTKRADVVSNVMKTTWLTRYPYPTQVALYKETKFMAEFTEMIASAYGVKKKPITARNPQKNSIIERIHQTVGNMIRSFEVHGTSIDEKDPWTEILRA
eukprot:7194446-Ditylum_brightwellii.AAC.1